MVFHNRSGSAHSRHIGAFQKQVAVRSLPPAHRTRPLGTECLPHTRSGHLLRNSPARRVRSTAPALDVVATPCPGACHHSSLCLACMATAHEKEALVVFLDFFGSIFSDARAPMQPQSCAGRTRYGSTRVPAMCRTSISTTPSARNPITHVPKEESLASVFVAKRAAMPVRAEEMLNGNSCITGEGDKVFQCRQPDSFLPVSPGCRANT